MTLNQELQLFLGEVRDHFQSEWLPFWEPRGCDAQYGGYITSYDEHGDRSDEGDKYIVTQARMIWCYSMLYSMFPEEKRFLEAARQGVDFMLDHFWDAQNEGWYWRTNAEGQPQDTAKVVYGEGFMIYALAQYGLSSGDSRGREYACRTFDLLQKYAADTFHGGYYENLETDWSLSAPGYAAGDRKSLDIHMHLLEAFTTLCELTGEELHRRKLNEVIDIILNRMIDWDAGCGRNQFDPAFCPIPAITIKRTWNDDRGKGEEIPGEQDTTSYGHNMELIWLLNRAARVLGDPKDRFSDISRRLVEHTLAYGFDSEFGGVYRDGPHVGPAIVHDKEWWQNCEVLVGFLDVYQLFGDVRYWEAFKKCWNFDRTYLINHDVGEWKQLVTRDGTPIIPELGNPWKAMYHTGRALMECIVRLTELSAQQTATD